MINIQKIDHVGIRVSNKTRSLDFYQKLGFELIADSGFEKGHPLIMRHSSGVVINLLGPGMAVGDKNILMDVDIKYPGYTHMALRIDSLEEVMQYFEQHQIEITGSFNFMGLKAVFIRDPDRNVIEFDEYEGDEPETRTPHDTEFSDYPAHP